MRRERISSQALPLLRPWHMHADRQVLRPGMHLGCDRMRPDLRVREVEGTQTMSTSTRPRHATRRTLGTLDPISKVILVLGVLVVGPLVTVQSLLGGDLIGTAIFPVAVVVTLAVRWWCTR